MLKLRLAVMGVVLLGSAGGAPAATIFTNVVIDGSLSSGAVYTTNNDQIEFTVPAATVGDVVDPLRIRTGTVIITYEAENDAGIYQNSLELDLMAALIGSGNIFVSEVVEDIDDPGIIASYKVLLDESSVLPLAVSVPFDRPSKHFKVKKSFLLNAIDTEFNDLASITGIGQTVPEPSTALLLAMAVLGVVRRR